MFGGMWGCAVRGVLAWNDRGYVLCMPMCCAYRRAWCGVLLKKSTPVGGLLLLLNPVHVPWQAAQRECAVQAFAHEFWIHLPVGL